MNALRLAGLCLAAFAWPAFGQTVNVLDQTTPAGDPLYQLAEPLTVLGYTIPAGFVTDLASTPAWIHDRLPPDGPWAPAAVLHDWLYVTNQVPRAEADRLFLQAMIDLGIPVRQRFPMYAAVAFFGGDAYGQNLGWAP